MRLEEDLVKYVDWVEEVLKAAVAAFDSNQTHSSSTNIQAVVRELGLDMDERAEQLHDALRDLERMGLVDATSLWNVTISQEARKIRVTSLRTAWTHIHDVWLEPRQEAFLAKLCEMSERRDEHWAHLEPVQGDGVLEAMGETPSRGESVPLIVALSDLGLVDKSHLTLGSFPTFPTYAGLVRATEKVATEGQTLVLRLLEDWETTNVDFKRELHLGTKDEKAEFVRDVLALANTQVTGDRYLVTGFDPRTRDFTTTVDPRVTQDTIENILNEFTKPSATVLYKTFAWTDGSGEVGLLEVRRDRARVPYRVSRRLAGEHKVIEDNQVFVRHGSHVATASDEEIADLEAEDMRARAS
jgi:hypothetical protein